jgi:hypothetical protein
MDVIHKLTRVHCWETGLCKRQIDDRLQLVNKPSYDLDPLTVKCNNKARVAQGKNTFLCESMVSFLRSVQIYFASLAGVLKSDLCGPSYTLHGWLAFCSA